MGGGGEQVTVLYFDNNEERERESYADWIRLNHA